MARHGVTVQEVMTANPITIKADAQLLTAYDLMEDQDIRRLPVVNSQGELEGIITLSDVQRAVPRELLMQLDAPSVDEKGLDADEHGCQTKRREAAHRKQVWEVMTDDPVVVLSADTIQDAAELMLEHKVSGVPVVAGTKVVGLITESDIFRLVVESWQ